MLLPKCSTGDQDLFGDQVLRCYHSTPLAAAMLIKCSQLASLDKNNNALREIKLRSSYLQGKSTTMSVIAHQTEKEWISANEKNRQRMAQIHAEGEAEKHAA
ncbi:hypothetical protein TNCV_3231371 [Trichonephila clavipes]|nr:hypothetical protein TNCV_3231371 [Trichonephila clavipes]